MIRLPLIAGLAVFVVLAPGTPGQASEPGSKPSALRTWFKHLREGLSESAVAGQYQKSKITAVAAVRGAPQQASDPEKPAWKGTARSRKAERLRKEKAEFAKAVDLVLEGKFEEGDQGLAAFEKAHPRSPLLPEVQEARQKAKDLQSGEPAKDQ